MPNWCYNRVTAFGSSEKLKEIEPHYNKSKEIGSAENKAKMTK